MYILVKQDQTTVYPYSFYQLRMDNPNISFPENMTDEQYAEWSVFRVESVARPQYDSNTHRVVESGPVLESGSWKQSWTIEQLSDAEIARKAAKLQAELDKQQREYLDNTDWYIIRKMETGIEVPREILDNRAAARASIVGNI